MSSHSRPSRRITVSMDLPEGGVCDGETLCAIKERINEYGSKGMYHEAQILMALAIRLEAGERALMATTGPFFVTATEQATPAPDRNPFTTKGDWR